MSQTKELPFSEQVEQGVLEVLEFVELEMAYSPVLAGPVSEGAMASPDCVPCPQLVVRQSDGRYRIDRPAEADFQFVDEFFLKPMRARYLVMRDFYYEALERGALGYSMQQAILARFFPNGVTIFNQRTEQGHEQEGQNDH